jgi:hypothetical protein
MKRLMAPLEVDRASAFPAMAGIRLSTPAPDKSQTGRG